LTGGLAAHRCAGIPCLQSRISSVRRVDRELGYSGTTTVGAPIPSIEIATLQRYAKIVEEKALMVLTEQQRSMWGPKLKGEFLRR
jgi:hypothetical protein